MLMTTRWVLISSLAAFLALTLAPRAHGAGPCGEFARAEFQQCISDPTEEFQAATDTCGGRDHSCVESCRSENLVCSDEAMRKTCGNRLAARARCVGTLVQCAKACVTGAAPGEVRQCKTAARHTYRASLGTCRSEAGSARRECRSKIRSCLDGCGADLAACDAPVRAEREAAIGRCNTEQRRAVAACHVAFPGGGPLREECIAQARDDGVVCRSAARLAARQGFLVCRQSLAACVTTCPSG